MTWSRSASTCGAAARRPAASCSAGCARPGSRGCGQDWRELLAAAAGRPRGQPPVRALAAASIAAAHRRVLAGGAAITADSPPERLHDLRKRCKELRYALEIFASLHAPDAAVAGREGAQGRCRTAWAPTRTPRSSGPSCALFAAQMMAQQSAPATTLLAMGEIAAGLARRERAARAEFDGLFRQFARPAGQDRMPRADRSGGRR